MKKRLIFGFICAVLLFIIMTSNDNTIVQKVTNFIITDSNDISCYEISATYGFPHLESGTFPYLRYYSILNVTFRCKSVYIFLLISFLWHLSYHWKNFIWSECYYKFLRKLRIGFDDRIPWFYTRWYYLFFFLLEFSFLLLQYLFDTNPWFAFLFW